MITVASVPAGHPYVHAIVDPNVAVLLPDPVPPQATQAGQWWPPRWLEPSYVRRHARHVDVLHLHFGFDTAAPDELRDVVDELDRHGVPLVVTVHDLHNPHFVDAGLHEARLDVLLAAADAVVTLTDGAADEIARRWRRESLILPHPHVLPIETVGRARVRRARPVVAVHAKALRANIDPWPVLDSLSRTDLGCARLRLDVDEEAMRSPRGDEVSAAHVRVWRDRGVDVRVHPRFDDAQLADYLAEIDVLVLPYRFGTHSGWVEACHDAGVRAVVPDCGHFHRQRPNPVFGYGVGRFDGASLHRAVAEALRSVVDSEVGEDLALRQFRADQRRWIRRETDCLYRRLRRQAA